jgi:aryl-alcohol dehydrogenase-like predicted oxidoreductase
MAFGFGCGGRYGGSGRRASLQLLETAIDCGINYFDTARMYGFPARIDEGRFS